MKVLAALLALLSPLVYAGNVEVTWVAPTEYEDGTPADSIDSYALHLAKDNAPLTPIIIPGDLTKHIIENVAVGQYSLYMTAIKNGLVSQPSNIVTFAVTEKRSNPNAPAIRIEFIGFEAEGLGVR